ncbi:MAG: hypothetical protein OWS74_07530 [Firmicutes bacterium]|nr:hypothetical protein [Bacillota bacterium]
MSHHQSFFVSHPYISGSLTLIAVLGFYLALPPVVPPAHSHPFQAALASESKTAAHKKIHKTPSTSTTSPSGTVVYTPAQLEHIASMAQKMELSVYLPHSGIASTLQLAYSQNGLLNLQYNNMLIIESNNPVPLPYAPTSTRTVQLSGGIQAQWLFTPPVGGPQYRLDFQKGSTYFRIQLFPLYTSGNCAHTEKVANALTPLTS